MNIWHWILIIIITTNAIAKLILTDFDVFVSPDAKIYFDNALALVEGQRLTSYPQYLHNIGFPLFLSGIFSIIPQDFTTLSIIQKLITIVFSVATIPIIYKIHRHFFNQPYSVLGTFVYSTSFVLLQNATFGGNDSMFLFFSALAISFAFKQNKFIALAIILAGIATIVRFEGILLVPVILIITAKYKGFKKTNLPYFSLFFIPVIAVAVLNIMHSVPDGFVTILHKESAFLLRTIHANEIFGALFNSLLYAGWFVFPNFLALLGLLYLMIRKQYWLIAITVVLFSSGIIAYIDAYDLRYFLPTLPFLSIATVFAVRKILSSWKQGTIKSTTTKIASVRTNYTDMRYGYVTIAPVLTYSNFILLAYNFTDIKELMPVWAFAIVFTVGLALVLITIGKIFRNKQLKVDEDLRYEQSPQRARTDATIIKALLEITTNDKTKSALNDRLNYLKRITKD